MLTAEKVVSKEFILKEVTDVNIMSFYLGIKNLTGTFKSPFRVDHTPSCCVWRNPKNNILFFRDWTENITLDCFQVVMKKYNIDYFRALYKIYLDLEKIKIEDIPPIEINPVIKNLQVFIKPSLEEHEVKYWKKYGINSALLSKYNVSAVKSVYINKVLTWRSTKLNPIFCYKFPESEKLKIYRPLNKDKQFKWLSSCKSSDIIGYDIFIKGKPKHNTLFIASSGKDAMVLNSYGFPAIAPVSETVILDSKVIEKLKSYYKYILVFMDSDEAGIKSNIRYKESYNIPYITIPYNYNVKDISDFREKYGYKKTKRFIYKSFRQFIPDNKLPF